MARPENVNEPHAVVWTLKGSSRKELRDAAVLKFLSEKGGYWKGDKKYVTKYTYYVETLADGKRVYLLRPTFLNKGIDFQVWVEGMKDGVDARPSHQDMFNDLNQKTIENPEKTKKLLALIDRLWNCEDPEEVLKGNKLEFKSGYSVEMILKILKWLFIEQDITYWNYDGRGMLKAAIDAGHSK